VVPPLKPLLVYVREVYEVKSVNVDPDPLSHCKLYAVMSELPAVVPLSADQDRVTEVSEYETIVGMTITLGTLLIFAPTELTAEGVLYPYEL